MNKILSTFIVVLSAVLIIHSLMYLIPGDPAEALAGEYASAEDVDAIRQELALDKGFWYRYAVYIKKVAVLDFGKSIYSGKPVLLEIKDRFLATFILASFSILIAVLVGVLFGLLAAVKKESFLDKAILWVSSVTISTPIFVTCICLTFVFSFLLGLFPPSGKDGLNLMYIVLPSLSLGSRSIALIVRVVRNEFLIILEKQYILMAKSMGFKRYKIIFVFAFKNILLPVITVILLDFGAYLGGAVVTESVFSWPGLGRLLMIAIQKRDLPLLQGVILFGTIVFLFIGILLDLLKRKISGEIIEQG